MTAFPKTNFAGSAPKKLGLSRVLLAHGELAPRLTLKTILEAAGYAVEVAGSPEEAMVKLDECQYDLVLSDAGFGTRSNVLAYARVKSYRPATALVTYKRPRMKRRTAGRSRQRVSIQMQDVPSLLGDIAELIGMRASRRYRLVRSTV